MKREIYFACGYGNNNRKMLLVIRVTGSHWLLMWLQPYVENKTKSPLPVVIEWLYRCAEGFHNGSAEILI